IGVILVQFLYYFYDFYKNGFFTKTIKTVKLLIIAVKGLKHSFQIKKSTFNQKKNSVFRKQFISLCDNNYNN
ncbi:MAG: hypothetical protein ACK4ON_02450, partial [Bacteroidia bacterium]